MNNRLLGTGLAISLIVVGLFLLFNYSNKNRPVSVRESAKLKPGFKNVTQLISDNKYDEAEKVLQEMQEQDVDTSALGDTYFNLALSYEAKDELVKARNIYQLILTKYQNIKNILDVQKKLGDLNIRILFSPVVTETDVSYKVQPGDTLSKIAKHFGTTIDLIKTSNSLESDMIRVDARLKVSSLKYKILIDKSQNVLTLFTEGDNIFKVYNVATGQNNSTPVGTFTIVNKIKDPVWYTQGAIVPAESPDNILGSRWMGFSEPEYGIHGTTEPESVGQQSTKGCIRMINEEVEELYTIIPVGTEVTIVD